MIKLKISTIKEITVNMSDNKITVITENVEENEKLKELLKILENFEKSTT